MKHVSSDRPEPSWLEPVQKKEIDLARVLGEVMHDTKGQSKDSPPFRQLLHYRAYDPVLQLNQNHQVVRRFDAEQLKAVR